MFCTKCGKEIDLNAKFCSKCGTMINNSIQNNTKSVLSMHYVVLQVVLKEKLIGTGSGNLRQLENVINTQAAKGYRLHTISTTSSGSTGLMGGDRIQATLVFEKLN